jgi:FMN phosphatase YigB (HAD superfamily)
MVLPAPESRNASSPRRRVTYAWRVKNWLARQIRQRRMSALIGASSATITVGELDVVLSKEPGLVVAFDVFDTLVRRTINPEKVKLLALDRLRRRLALSGIDTAGLYQLRHRIEAELCRANADVHGELEFCFADMAQALHQELCIAGIDPVLSNPDDFVEALFDCELEIERSVLRPIPEVVAVLAAVQASSRTVVLISDFYLPADRLRALLASVGVSVAPDRIFVSCDRMASKRSGRMFPIVAKALGVTPADMIMIGDNPHSDGAMAKTGGLSSILLDAQANHAFYASPQADPSLWPNAERAFRAVIGADGIWTIREVAPALLLFIERLYAQARQNGYRHLFFLAREGQLLRDLFEAYQTQLGLAGDARIATHYLIVSRRACFLCSLRPLAEENFAGLFANYRQISLADFLHSLRFTADEIADFAEDLGVDAACIEEDFPTSTTFAHLRALPRFQAAYEKRRSEQRNNFLLYLAQFNVDLEAHPLVLVDVGWKGTIQDFILATVPSEIEVQGLYLGLLYAGQSVANKTGLLFSNIGGLTSGFFVYGENRSLFEILLCADHGSAHSYVRGPDGRVSVTLDDNADEAVFVRTYVKPVADDLINTVKRLGQVRGLYCVPDSRWEEFVKSTHSTLVFRPWDDTAQWLVNARHRENFGVFGTSTFSSGQSPSLTARMSFLVRLLREPRRVLYSSFWPSFTLYQYGGRALIACYAGYRRWQERRLAPSLGILPNQAPSNKRS